MIGEQEKSLKDNSGFSKRAGGAPANVAVAAARMDAEVSLAASVGGDEFGTFLIDKIAGEDIGTERIVQRHQRTTLAFVSLDEEGKPHFIFYRGADEIIEEEQLKDIESDVLHVGSLPFTNSDTAEKIIEAARRTDADVSFDPNLREDLRTPGYERRLEEFLKEVDILTAAEEELEFFGGLEKLREDIPEIVVTRGSQGAELYTEDKKQVVEAGEVDVVDTTGAGDALTGTYLAFRKEGRETALKKAVKAASISTTSVGAIDSLPYLEEL